MRTPGEEVNEPVFKKFTPGAALGAKYTTGLSNAAHKITPAAPTAGYKGRRKLPKRGALQKLGHNVRSKTAGAMWAVAGDASKVTNLGLEGASHTIFKSYIPGRGYIKASEAGVKALRQAAKDRPGHAVLQRKRNRIDAEKFRKVTQDHKELIARTTNHSRYNNGVNQYEPTGSLGMYMAGTGTRGFMIRTGSAKGGQSHLFMPKGTDNATLNHEMTHGTPRRSSYRMYQITKNPKKTMREEARAEMGSGEAHTYYRTPRTRSEGMHDSFYVRAARSPGERYDVQRDAIAQSPSLEMQEKSRQMFSDESVEGFKQVQDKIANARRARGKQAHESPNYADQVRTGIPHPGRKKDRIKVHWQDNKDQYQMAGLVAGGTALYAGMNAYEKHRTAKFRGNQYMDRNGAKRGGVHKSFETLDMGGAMVTEDKPKKDLPVRDLQTGRFVGTPHLQKHSRAHDSLVWTKDEQAD